MVPRHVGKKSDGKQLGNRSRRRTAPSDQGGSSTIIHQDLRHKELALTDTTWYIVDTVQDRLHDMGMNVFPLERFATLALFGQTPND